jgi:hypothetical protein
MASAESNASAQGRPTDDDTAPAGTVGALEIDQKLNALHLFITVYLRLFITV